MNRAEYEAAMCQKLSSAGVVPFKKVSVGDWVPVESDCHKNVDRWVEAMPDHRAERGWVVYKQCLVGDTLGLELTAHSVVRGEADELFDITPLHDERQRPSMRFVAHFGDEADFWRLEKNNRFICCVENELRNAETGE